MDLSFRLILNDGVFVGNDPVNFVDPLGLVSYGQLGIGNPGSYGGENDCDKLEDDFEGDVLYGDPLYSPEDLIGMLPIGGVAGKLSNIKKGC